jgi:hypothetical protein
MSSFFSFVISFFAAAAARSMYQGKISHISFLNIFGNRIGFGMWSEREKINSNNKEKEKKTTRRKKKMLK